MITDLSGNTVVHVDSRPPDTPHPNDIPNGPTGATGPSDPSGPTGPIGLPKNIDMLAIAKQHDLTTISYVKRFMNEDYSDAGFNMSTSMDILAVYIKAQKILYTEAKVYCEQQLNMLMLPAIFISALCTLLSLALQGIYAGPYIISGLTAVNSFILALISYLKLDAKAEAHKTSAYHYTRLLTICEFQSGKIMFFKRDDNKEYYENLYNEIFNLVKEIEKRIEEIQDTNKFMLPQYIRYNFRTLNEQNLFSTVKNLQLRELEYLNDLKISIRKLDEKRRLFLDPAKSYDMCVAETPDTDPKKIILNSAIEDKEEKMKRIIHHRHRYLVLGEAFDNEINEYIQKAKGHRYCCNCNWLKS